MLFDLSIALQLRHDLSKVVAPTPRSGACETWYPWVPTDQAHGRPRQVGLAYQKTRRPVSGPNWPSWRPTRPPEDLLEDSPEWPQYLACKTRHRWILTKPIDRYGKSCNIDLGLQVITDQESGNRSHPLANIRRARRPLYEYAILKQSTPTTGCRVLLSGDPNQYKVIVFSVFRVLVRNLRVLSLRFHLAEQLNHRD
jgi:hypothetical protein